MMSHEVKKLVQAPEQVTQGFKIFMRDILRYRCLLSGRVYERCFNNDKSWNLLHRAFIHKSMSNKSLELLEFHGDVSVNLSVVEYIRDEFPEVTSLDWNSGLNEVYDLNLSNDELKDFARQLGSDWAFFIENCY